MGHQLKVVSLTNCVRLKHSWQRGFWLLLGCLMAVQAVFAEPHGYQLEIRFKHLFTDDQFSESDNINAVTTIVQDLHGFLWFGGENGLARYNGATFEMFQTSALDPNAISGNYVWDTVLDHSGALWVATGQGLNRYDPANNNFIRYTTQELGPGVALGHGIVDDVLFSLAVTPDDTLYIGSSKGLLKLNPERTEFKLVESLGAQYIRKVYVDDQGNLWVGTSEHGLYYLDRQRDQFKQWHFNPDDPQSLPHNYVRAIAQDSKGDIWVGTLGGGVAHLAADGNHFTRYQHSADDEQSLGADSIWDIHTDLAGNLWVATDPGGLALYLPEEDRFHTYKHNPYNLSSINSNKVRAIYNDQMGDLWVGVFPAGLNYFDKSTAQFDNFQSHPEESSSLSQDNVVTFFEDSKGTLWVGTEGGLNAFDETQRKFTRYLADEGNPDALQANAILAIEEDRSGDLWVGTWAAGLHRFNQSTQTFKQYPVDPTDPNSLGDGYIWSLLYDSQDRLWVGTENSGLHLYVPETDQFRRFMPNAQDPTSLSFRHVWTLLEDSKKRIWVGTIDGLNLLEKLTPEKAEFRHFSHDSTDVNSLSSNRIISLYEDHQGILWVGTQDTGLNRFNVDKNEIRHVGTAQGLPSGHISSIVEDGQGFIWVSTVNGLAMIDPNTLKVRTFSESNGLVSNNFNRDASYKDAQGRLYFGGVKGFSIFDPREFNQPIPAPNVVITDFRLFNKSVYADSRHSPLTKAISETDEITLSHRHTMFAFDFFAVSFRAAHRNLYAYKLEGFDHQWNEVGNKYTATYTNIDPGDYVFRVKAANSDGVWNEHGPSIRIHITAAPWRTGWAYLGYVSLAVLLFIAIIISQKKKIVYQNERTLNEKLLKLDRIKDSFLANTSHELRTPLNGIIGLAEALQNGTQGEVSDNVRGCLKIISSSGRRLSNLINDILDFSKLSEKKLEVRVVPVALYPVVELVLELLSPLVGNKELLLINDVPRSVCVMADEDRLQQILLNLVGNAIKFSRRGHVRVFVEVNPIECVIAVEDTGTGIAPRDLQQIFTAFTQLDHDETREQGGTGLGLAITKQLVELHGGTIQVDSQIGIGSTFKFSLNVCDQMVDPTTTAISARVDGGATEKLNPILVSENDDVVSLLKPADRGDCYTILIVDDDAINRMVLTSILAIQNYNIIEADSGIEAVAMLEGKTSIDLVIMDVMMPKMSGYEACMRIRARYPVHVLPILFLTAKNFSDDLVRGFVAGGNDFLTKPVSKHELLSRVSTHLSLLDINRRLEEKYQQACSANIHNDREMRALEHIVQIINREMDFRVLLRDMLEDVKNLIQADQIVYWQTQESDQPYYAVLGGDVDGMNEVCLHDGANITAQLEVMHQEGQAIVILEDLADPQFQFVADSFPGCVSTVLMTIYFEKTVVGFITVLSFDESTRFTAEAIETLTRIHAHVTSAVVKAKLLEKLGLDLHPDT